MKISAVSEYIRNNAEKTKKLSNDCIQFYNSQNELFGYMQKDYYGQSKLNTFVIFKNGAIYLYKSIKRTFEKIYVAGKKTDDDKLVVKSFITDITENNYEAKTKTKIRKIINLETPYKLMEEYPIQAQIYKIDEKLKYSKPQIEQELVTNLKSKANTINRK